MALPRRRRQQRAAFDTPPAAGIRSTGGKCHRSPLPACGFVEPAVVWQRTFRSTATGARSNVWQSRFVRWERAKRRRSCLSRPPLLRLSRVPVMPRLASQAHVAAANGSRGRAAVGDRFGPVGEAVASSALTLYKPLLEGLEEASPILDQRSVLVDQALAVWARPGFEVFICQPRLRFEPFPYQLEAAARVLRHMQGRAILADEVGLGKTIEAGIVLSELRLRGLAGRVLVLTPTGLVGQWCEELERKFALPCVIADRRFEAPSSEGNQPIVVASLAAARREQLLAELTAPAWDLVIADEAHRLKNARSASARLARSLRTRYMLLLTATPIENRLSDLFQLVSLVRPGLLGAAAEFRARHGRGRPGGGTQRRVAAACAARVDGPPSPQRDHGDAAAAARRDDSGDSFRRGGGAVSHDLLAGTRLGARRDNVTYPGSAQHSAACRLEPLGVRRQPRQVGLAGSGGASGKRVEYRQGHGVGGATRTPPGARRKGRRVHGVPPHAACARRNAHRSRLRRRRLPRQA